MKHTKIFKFFTLLSSIGAVFLHGLLTWEYFNVKYSLGGNTGFCKISSEFNCPAVIASQYSNIIGIPNSIFGFWTNLIFLGLLIWIFLEEKFFSRRNQHIIFLIQILSYLIIGASVVFGFISAFILGHFCLLCVGTYIMSVIQFIGVFILYRTDLLNGWRSNLKPVLSLISIPVLSFFSYQIILDQLGGKRLEYFINESIAYWKTSSIQQFDYKLGLKFPAKSSSSYVTVVEFIDPFCPYCKLSTDSFKILMATRDDIELLVKFFPLDHNCNSYIPGPSYDAKRCHWTRLFLCLEEKKAGAGKEALYWLFEHQVRMAKLSFEEGLSDLLKDLFPMWTQEELAYCQTSQSVETQLKNMIDEGHKAEIKGTPAVFLKNRLLQGGHVIPLFEKALTIPLKE